MSKINLFSLFTSDPVPVEKPSCAQPAPTTEQAQSLSQRFQEHQNDTPAQPADRLRSIPVPVSAAAPAVQASRVFTNAQIADVRGGTTQNPPIVFTAEQVANARGGVIFDVTKIQEIRDQIRSGQFVSSFDAIEADEEETADSITVEKLNSFGDVTTALDWAEDLINDSSYDTDWDSNDIVRAIVQFCIENIDKADLLSPEARTRIAQKVWNETSTLHDFYDEFGNYVRLYVG